MKFVFFNTCITIHMHIISLGGLWERRQYYSEKKDGSQ